MLSLESLPPGPSLEVLAQVFHNRVKLPSSHAENCGAARVRGTGDGGGGKYINDPKRRVRHKGAVDQIYGRRTTLEVQFSRARRAHPAAFCQSMGLEDVPNARLAAVKPSSRGPMEAKRVRRLFQCLEERWAP